MVSVAKLTDRSPRVAIKPVNYDLVLRDTLMGVEVEVDTDTTCVSIHPHPSTLTFWNKHHDGSLTNGYEYTLRSPMAGTELSTAIAQLFAPPSEFYRTFTGSTHIHIDMLEEEVTLDVLRTMVLLVYTLEPVLYAAGDPTREWCGYANSLKSAEPLLLSALFSDDVRATFTSTYRRGGELGRYYGLNLAALTDYGSLEFRYFPTASSAEELVHWINLVQSFKKAALGIVTPSALKAIINDHSSFQNMLQTYFPAYETLFAQAVDWRKVHSMLSKAGVVMNDAKLTEVPRFKAEEVFASGRFAKLASVASVGNMDFNGAVPATIYSNNRIPPAPNEGEVLVYGSNVYLRLRGEWRAVNENLPRAEYVEDGTLAAVQSLLINGGIEITERSIYSCEQLLVQRRIPSYGEEYLYESHPSYTPVEYDEEEDEY